MPPVRSISAYVSMTYKPDRTALAQPLSAVGRRFWPERWFRGHTPGASLAWRTSWKNRGKYVLARQRLGISPGFHHAATLFGSTRSMFPGSVAPFPDQTLAKWAKARALKPRLQEKRSPIFFRTSANVPGKPRETGYTRVRRPRQVSACAVSQERAKDYNERKVASAENCNQGLRCQV